MNHQVTKSFHSAQVSANKRFADLVCPYLFSVVVPAYRTPPDILKASLKSILDQVPPPHEVIIVDDSGTNSTVASTVKSIPDPDCRLKLIINTCNVGISNSTNIGVAAATGDFIFFVDHDDELAPNALLAFIECMVKKPGTDVWYSDQCTIDGNGAVKSHFLKPDWSPIYALGVMYVGHLLAVRTSLCRNVLLRPNYDGVQDFDFLLRLSEETRNIGHVHFVAYKWRAVLGSLALGGDEKLGINVLQARAVNEHITREGKTWRAVSHPACQHRIVLGPSRHSPEPRISIVIPSRNQGEILSQCLESIFTLTDYSNFEVVLVDNRTTDPVALRLFDFYPLIRVKYGDKSFNYSKANNLGAKAASGELLLFLNNDTEVVESDWLRRMAMYFEDREIGAVGATLLYPNRSVQHAGVILGPRGTADHVMRGFEETSDGYAGSLVVSREVSAVTAACLMIRSSMFHHIGGFNTDYNKHYQDVDLCLKITERGFRIISVGNVRVIHHESLTRKSEGYDHGDRAILIDRWRGKIEVTDPYYNPGFVDGSVDYTMKPGWIG